MDQNRKLLLFYLNENIFAADILQVERVVRMVEITKVPKSGDSIIGVIDFHGKIIPILDINSRLDLKSSEIKLEHKILIVKGKVNPFGFIIDDVHGVYSEEELSVVNSEKIIPGLNLAINEVAKYKDEFVMIYEIDKILSSEENKFINELLENDEEIS